MLVIDMATNAIVTTLLKPLTVNVTYQLTKWISPVYLYQYGSQAWQPAPYCGASTTNVASTLFTTKACQSSTYGLVVAKQNVSISSIDTNVGPDTGNTVIFVSGFFYNNLNYTCKFGNSLKPATYLSVGLIHCTAPPGVVGSVPFSVIVESLYSITGFSYTYLGTSLLKICLTYCSHLPKFMFWKWLMH
jgi:hypothetical protein